MYSKGMNTFGTSSRFMKKPLNIMKGMIKTGTRAIAVSSFGITVE